MSTHLVQKNELFKRSRTHELNGHFCWLSHTLFLMISLTHTHTQCIPVSSVTHEYACVCAWLSEYKPLFGALARPCRSKSDQKNWSGGQRVQEGTQSEHRRLVTLVPARKNTRMWVSLAGLNVAWASRWSDRWKRASPNVDKMQIKKLKPKGGHHNCSSCSAFCTSIPPTPVSISLDRLQLLQQILLPLSCGGHCWVF